MKTENKLLLFVIFILAAGGFLLSQYLFSFDNGILEAYFLDVGQGDAILIKSPTGTLTLIDGGDGEKIIEELGKVLPYGKREIDMVIATHPDKDHIGGLNEVYDRFEVGRFLYSPNNKDSTAMESLMERVEDEGSQTYMAHRLMALDLGGGAYLDILFPDRTVPGLESNTASIVGKLVYREHEFLLTGDSPDSIEEYLVLLDGAYLRSDVLKVGHHGSKTSTGADFLRVVSPQYGVISYGADNFYGHPHKVVVDRLEGLAVKRLDTAGRGTLRFQINQGLKYNRIK